MTQNGANPGAAPARKRPWGKIILVVSLSLNLLVAGIIGGAILKWGPEHGKHHEARLDKFGGPLTRALSHDDRKAIGREMWRSYRRDGGGGKARHRAVIEALIVDLRADPVDREALAGHLARQRAQISERLSFGQGILLERLVRMSPQERNAYADRLEAELRKHRRRDHGHDRDKD